MQNTCLSRSKIRAGATDACGGEQGGEASSDPSYRKVRQLNLTSDQGGVGRSGFWRMEWGEGQDSEAQGHPILLVTFTSWTIGLGSMLGCDGKWRLWRKRLLLPEPFCGGKFLFGTTVTQLLTPPPGSALRHSYLCKTPSIFRESRISIMPQENMARELLRLANEMKRIVRWSSPESTKALHHLAYKKDKGHSTQLRVMGRLVTSKEGGGPKEDFLTAVHSFPSRLQHGGGQLP